MEVTIGQNKKELEWREGEAYVDDIHFDGHRRLWSFSYEPKTYLKESELSGDEWRKGGSIKIFMDGDCVYEEFCREPIRAAAKIVGVLPKVMDCEILHPAKGGNFKEAMKGRPIYYRDIPAIVDHWVEGGEIIIKTADGTDFPPWGFQIEAQKEDGSYEDEWKDTDRVSILSEKISWFRKI